MGKIWGQISPTVSRGCDLGEWPDRARSCWFNGHERGPAWFGFEREPVLGVHDDRPQGQTGRDRVAAATTKLRQRFPIAEIT